MAAAPKTSKIKNGKNGGKKWARVLHPNRYFIWAIFFIVVGCAALVAYIDLSAIAMENQTVYYDLQARHTYADPQAGFSVMYPASWQLENDQSGDVIFENPNNTEENITVATSTPDMESVIRSAIVVRQETDSQKSGYSVAIIQAATKKGDTPFDAAIIKTSSKLFYISGRSAVFGDFVSSFRPEAASASAQQQSLSK